MTEKENIFFHQQILSLFKQFLLTDIGFMAALQRYGGEFEVLENEWRFSLPAMYVFCCSLFEGFDSLSYNQFRKLLYQHPTNQLLKSYGGQVLVSTQKNNINRTIYVLKRER